MALSMIDLTTLEGKDTPGKVKQMCCKALHLCDTHPSLPTVAAVCVYPSMVALAKKELKGSSVKVASVSTAFPSGQAPWEVKLLDTRFAVDEGADEIDMVIDLGRAIMGDWDYIQSDVAAVRAVTTGKVLKVILETAALTNDQIAQVCLRSKAAGADYVKTATGFHPAGGADVRAIKVMHDTVGGALGIKASGGIKTAEFAQELIAAGATRLGLSGSRAILEGIAATGSY
jgi:deoxyribose-phosphate aldolase